MNIGILVREHRLHDSWHSKLCLEFLILMPRTDEEILRIVQILNIRNSH